MNRRTFIISTAVLTVPTLAGCSGSSNEASTETQSRSTTTPTTGNTDSATSSNGGTSTESLNKLPDNAVASLRRTYEAWAATDPDAFLANLHSTNNYPEKGVRGNVPDFEGKLTNLKITDTQLGLTRSEIEDVFETGPNLSADDATVFVDTKHALVSVDPTVDGKAANDTQKNFKSFLNQNKNHFLAVEEGTWRFVL